MKLKLDPATLQIIRKPVVQLTAAAVAGAVLLGIAGALLVLPQQNRLKAVDEEADLSRSQTERMEKMPVPAKVNDAQLLALLEQIPVQEEPGRLLRTLRETAEAAGVSLVSLSNGQSQTSQQNNLEQLLTKASQVEQGQVSPSPSPAEPTPAPPANPQEKPAFTESSFELTISGYYGQTMDFLSRLQHQPRLLHVKEWSLLPQVESAKAASTANSSVGSVNTGTRAKTSASPSQSGELPVQLKLKLSAYTAPQYAGRLVEPPRLEAGSPDVQRKDPTWSDKKLWELVKPDGTNP